jgi:hypothetical protein
MEAGMGGIGKGAAPMSLLLKGISREEHGPVGELGVDCAPNVFAMQVPRRMIACEKDSILAVTRAAEFGYLAFRTRSDRSQIFAAKRTPEVYFRQ